MEIIKRDITPLLLKAANATPVVTITGPRQSGKTTLCRGIFTHHQYVNLELLDVREFANTDPKGFLNSLKNPCIIDEVQNVPHLLSYIQVYTDENPGPGRYILTGSQNFLLNEKISQSLAGRTLIYNLLPFSISELRSSGQSISSFEDYIFRGFYPRVYQEQMPVQDWLSAYLQTYVEKDVRQIINIQDLSKFQLFLKLCAGRIGQLVNFSSLSIELGVDDKTIRKWLSLLESSYIVFLLQPHHQNFNKRLVKTPKLYFHDVGLASLLLGINSPEQIVNHYLKGSLFENLVIADVVKNRLNQGKRPSAYFWRSSKGEEIDLLIENGTGNTAIEIKAGSTLNSFFFDGLKFYSKISGLPPENCVVVYGGDDNQTRSAARVLSWRELSKLNV